MKRLILKFPPNSDEHYIHKVRNFAEDLFREIETSGLASIGDIDAADYAVDHLVVEIKKKSNIGLVKQQIGKLLKEHYLENDVVFDSA